MGFVSLYLSHALPWPPSARVKKDASHFAAGNFSLAKISGSIFGE
jgi:hypothetical protein